MKIVRRTLADGTVKVYRYRRRTNRILPQSLGAVIQEYRRSPEFAALKPSTQAVYLRAMACMEKGYKTRVVDIRRRHVIKLRDKHRGTPALANQIIAVFQILLNYAVDMEYIDYNPATKIKRLEVGEYTRWDDAAVAFALATFPERFRKAIILALYTGQREGDVLAMQWSDYDGEGIQVAQEKTGAKLWIPCHSVLRAELEAWKRDRTSTRIVVNAQGRPYKAKTFNSTFAREMRSHPEMNGLVFHGLRKTAAAKLAEAGCSTHEIAAITGHKTMQMIMHYTSQAEQRTRARAAIVKLENAGKTPPKPLKANDVS